MVYGDMKQSIDIVVKGPMAKEGTQTETHTIAQWFISTPHKRKIAAGPTYSYLTYKMVLGHPIKEK
jgi:hypothetical protein